MTSPSTARRTAETVLAEVLAAHTNLYGYPNRSWCGCGWNPDKERDNTNVLRFEAHRAHVAEKQADALLSARHTEQCSRCQGEGATELYREADDSPYWGTCPDCTNGLRDVGPLVLLAPEQVGWAWASPDKAANCYPWSLTAFRTAYLDAVPVYRARPEEETE